MAQQVSKKDAIAKIMKAFSDYDEDFKVKAEHQHDYKKYSYFYVETILERFNKTYSFTFKINSENSAEFDVYEDSWRTYNKEEIFTYLFFQEASRNHNA